MPDDEYREVCSLCGGSGIDPDCIELNCSDYEGCERCGGTGYLNAW